MKKMESDMGEFICERIEALFDKPPLRQKTPFCPDGFVWQGVTHRVTDKLSEWSDFTRRGRMARNMSVEHASAASRRGSLGVGRFYFRVRVKEGRIFELYYDRAVVSVDDRLGHWFLYREVNAVDADDTSIGA
jgi:hypothetical protein